MLTALPDSMRGAILMCAATGTRLDNTAERGIRVSRMDITDETSFSAWLETSQLSNIHVREALVLASKVAAAPDIAAELCWSDDPDYTTGYVASKTQYIRIPHLKSFGSPVGGRIFFVSPGSDIDNLITYLEEQPVLIKPPLPGGDNYAISD
ncbi:6-carboxyhexanoate--CoA ligase [bioreactor metagenome]|uniref:6-carboxyhexanoate--CoA ligase n=1 Tax=bioreactor metagenome TaxID=1076179 RepID=A0A645HQ15_9ZZZZ